MADYDTLRAAIDSYIKANGNKEITGTVLNDILNAMVSALGADTRFAGVAVPTTNPGNPEGNVVYFASQAGTYSNFGGIVLPLGIHILVWNGTAWTSQTWFSVDNTPTQNSQNLATSGGILQAIVDAVGVERLRAIGAEVTSCSFDGTTKKISFFNSADDTLFQLDATAFVIDGMVNDVKIEDGNLVIQFNTDAGKQDIEIPLTDIFNPANYYTKTAIDALLALYYTKTEVDGLLSTINSKLGEGYLYKGIATSTTAPGTPTTKVFYIATQAGTYTNFGNITVTEGITTLKYDGSNWIKEQLQGVDDEPTAGSDNLVKSGGVAEQISQLEQVVIGVNEYQEYTGNIDTTYIDTSSTAKYKVVRVKGGEHLFVKSTTITRIAILSDFTYNPVRPYDLIFATGETARRQVQGSYIEVDLPNDARYVLLQTVYDYGIGRVTIKDFVLDGENYLANIKDNLYDIAENAYTPYFSSEKDFGLTDKDRILALKNALIKCAWYSVPSVTKIGIFTYQLNEGSFFLWFANCDALADDAVITQDKAFAVVQAEYANNKDVQKFDIVQAQQIVGYVIVDIGLLVSSGSFVYGSTPTTYKNSGLSFIEIDTEQQIEDVRAETNLALKQSSPVKELAWSVKFNGETNSYITPNNNIVLSQDGDSLQIEVSNVLSASMNSGGYAFSKGTDGGSVRGIFISTGGIAVRSDDGTWVFQSVIADSSAHLKIKLEYSSGNILLYINDQLNSTYTGQKTITIIGFGNGVVSQYPTYWRGVIDSIQYNSDTLSFYTDFTFGLGVVLYRTNGFLTNEQAELLSGQGAELYISKTASVLNLYKKLPDGNYIKYPLEYRQKGFTENQYPSYYDNWGIGKPILCSFNGTMVEQVELFSGAEAELALTTPDAKDGSYTYVGGAMHGFENIIIDVNNGRSIRMYINGILIGESDVIALMPVQSVEVIQKSNLCPAYTNENPFADILKHWYFNRDGLKITTTISITKSVTFAQTMMGMLGVLRHWNGIVTNDYLTNKAIKNNLPFTIYDVEDGWEDVAANSGLKNRDVNCTEIKLCGEKGFGFALKIQSDDTKQTGGMFMSTNGGQPYNKTYFDLTGAITSLNIGDTLEATQHWVIE